MVRTYPELSSLIDDTSAHLAALLSTIQSDPHGGVHGDGVARVVLTGGTAGVALLRRMAQPDRAEGVDWGRVHVYFGDERNVAVTHPDSNEGQAREALLERVGVPEAHIHGFGLDGGVMNVAVEKYARVLAETAPAGFDLHLLGMGGEGHINSLFPHTDAVRERERLVVAVTDSPKPPAERATLTLPAVARAERVWLLVSGAEKAEAAQAAACAIADAAVGVDPEAWPVAGARGRSETVLFVTDDAAPRQ